MKKKSLTLASSLKLQAIIQDKPYQFTAHPCKVPKRLNHKWDMQMFRFSDSDPLHPTCHFLWFNGSHGNYYYFQRDDQWYKIAMSQRGHFIPLIGFNGEVTLL